MSRLAVDELKSEHSVKLENHEIIKSLLLNGMIKSMLKSLRQSLTVKQYSVQFQTYTCSIIIPIRLSNNFNNIQMYVNKDCIG